MSPSAITTPHHCQPTQLTTANLWHPLQQTTAGATPNSIHHCNSWQHSSVVGGNDGSSEWQWWVAKWKKLKNFFLFQMSFFVLSIFWGWVGWSDPNIDISIFFLFFFYGNLPLLIYSPILGNKQRTCIILWWYVICNYLHLLFLPFIWFLSLK